MNAKRALLVAGSGGHLEQLVRLVRRIPAIDADRALWVTFDSPQSRDLLRGRDVVWARYPPPRAIWPNIVNARLAASILRRDDFEVAVSTGASIAVSFLPLARARGVPAHFIDSATRTRGPSMTGRILRRVPGVRTSCQYRSWAGSSWSFVGSVFDQFVARPPTRPTADVEIRRIVVTVGTSEGFGFRALIERLVDVVPAGVDVLWQTGATEVADLGIDGRPSVPRDELAAAIGEADVVVSHAGIGSALTALEAGHKPVLVPRRSVAGEHVDDHQSDIARELDERGLAVVGSPRDLSWADLLEAASIRVVLDKDPDPLLLP